MCHCIQVYLFSGRCFSCMFSHLWPGDCVHSPSWDELDYAQAVSKPKDSTCNEANLQTTLITGLCLWCDHCLTGFCFDRKLITVQQVGTCSQAWNPGWGAMIWPVEPLNYILLLTNATTFFFCPLFHRVCFCRQLVFTVWRLQRFSVSPQLIV